MLRRVSRRFSRLRSNTWARRLSRLKKRTEDHSEDELSSSSEEENRSDEEGGSVSELEEESNEGEVTDEYVKEILRKAKNVLLEVQALYESDDFKVGFDSSGPDGYLLPSVEWEFDFDDGFDQNLESLVACIRKMEDVKYKLKAVDLSPVDKMARSLLPKFREERKELYRLRHEAQRVGIDMGANKYRWFPVRLRILKERGEALKRLKNKSIAISRWICKTTRLVSATIENLKHKLRKMQEPLHPPFVGGLFAAKDEGYQLMGMDGDFLRAMSTMPHFNLHPRRIYLDGSTWQEIEQSLSPEEIFEEVKDVKVLFSFASRDGGLDKATEMKEELSKRLGLASEEVYIDCDNLSGHRCTETKGGKVLNPHWAEFYLFAAMMTYVVIFVVDDAWRESKFCQQENSLFLEHLFRSYFHGADPKQFYGSEFDLIIAYCQIKTYLTDDEALGLVHDINSAIENSILDPMYSMGVPESKPVSFVDWEDFVSLERFVESGLDRVSKVCRSTLSPEDSKQAAVNLFSAKWQKQALESEDLEGHVCKLTIRRDLGESSQAS